MKRMSVLTISLLLVMGFGIFCLSAGTAFSAEEKKVSVTGIKPAVGTVSASLGALSLLGRAGETTYALTVAGSASAASELVVEGENHDASGNLTGAGDRPGLVTDEVVGSLSTSNAVVSGDPSALLGGEDLSAVDPAEMVAYFKYAADLTITADTAYDETNNIGGAADYQIVYVQDAQLTLEGDFEGYGVLVIDDQNPASSRDPRLVMLNNAKWVGLVLVNQADGAGSADDVTRVKMMGTAASTGFDVGDFVLLGIDSIAMHNHQDVASGDVGVVNAGGTFTADAHGVWGGSIMADNLSLGHHCTVAGDLHYNTGSVDHHSSIGGATYTTLSTPLLTLPTFPSFSAGVADVSLGNNATHTLAAGSYKDITFGSNGVLYLSGGDYYIEDLSMGVWGEVYFQAPTTLHVAGDINIDNGFTLQADAGSGLSAKDCMLYVAGDFDVDRNHVVIYANLYMPNGSFTGHNHIELGGAFIARSIEFHNHFNVPASLDSGFGSAGGGSAERPQILGAVLMAGSQFHIPNGETYADILYSSEVLTAVDSELAARPFKWVDWREDE
ncbi:MAG: hypothetical protein JW937_04995 [Candidatus Omnitrophica bacterium]|nr:hypothetical protein [Candidatus Omnitrophota bacterium]